MDRMKKKSKDFMIYFDDNGVVKHYDDTYDITIHCESEEEQRATLERIRSKRWIPCSERLPSKADHIDDMVLVCYRNGSVRFNTYMNGWVQGNPVAWMPLPEPYKEEADDERPD